jgi:hypothetical protein
LAQKYSIPFALQDVCVGIQFWLNWGWTQTRFSPQFVSLRSLMFQTFCPPPPGPTTTQNGRKTAWHMCLLLLIMMDSAGCAFGNLSIASRPLPNQIFLFIGSDLKGRDYTMIRTS